jgi:hypothetical protein
MSAQFDPDDLGECHARIEELTDELAAQKESSRRVAAGFCTAEARYIRREQELEARVEEADAALATMKADFHELLTINAHFAQINLAPPTAKRVYVFMVQRKQDAEPWPCVYTHADLAEKANGRVSPVIAINLEPKLREAERGQP